MSGSSTRWAESRGASPTGTGTISESRGHPVADVHGVAVRDGAMRSVTDALGQYGTPGWSPDGKTIACFGVEKALGSASKNVHLWLWPSTGGGRGTDLLAAWDRTLGSALVGRL